MTQLIRLTRAGTFRDNGIFHGNKSAFRVISKRFHFGFSPPPASAEPPQQRQMRFLRRFASHSRREAARLLLRATSGPDVTRPEPVAEILPLEDDGTLRKVRQQLRQLLLHFQADFRVEHLLVAFKQFVHLLSDSAGVGFVDGRHERREVAALHRVVDGHEVGVEVVGAEKLQHFVRRRGRRRRRRDGVFEVFLQRRDVFLADGRFEKLELRLDESPPVGDGHGGGEGEGGDDEEEEEEGGGGEGGGGGHLDVRLRERERIWNECL